MSDGQKVLSKYARKARLELNVIEFRQIISLLPSMTGELGSILGMDRVKRVRTRECLKRNSDLHFRFILRCFEASDQKRTCFQLDLKTVKVING